MAGKKVHWILAVLLAIGLFLSGCGARQEPPKAAGEVIKVGIRKDIASLDPGVSGKGGPDPQRYLIYEPLLYLDQDFNLKGRLAESWSSDDQGKTWTVKLKKGVQFSDGTPFNAAAVKFSLEYLAKSKRIFWPLERIETPDDYTVKLVFKRPYAILPYDLTTAEIFSPTSFDAEGKFKAPIGTGPFVFKEWQKEQELIFERNENYWGTKPKIKTVVFKVIPDHQTRAMALQSAEIDVADYLPVNAIREMEKTGKFSIYRKASPCMNWIAFNTYREPFSDLRVRQAVCYAVDVKRIIESVVGREIATPALKGPLSSPAHEYIRKPDLEWYTYNPDKARELLSQAGWKPGGDGVLEKNGKKFRVTLIASTLYEEGKAIAEAVQADLKKVGIDVEVRVLESAARFDALKQRNYDLIEMGGICPHNDPTPWFGYYFGTQHPEYCVLENRQIQELVNKLYSTVEPEARRQLFYRLQELLKEQAPGIFLYNQEAVTVARKDLRGFVLEGGMPGTYSYLRTISLGS
ncbi:ABC transporter substrate-binding protein [Desulfothermobacter acidiphilus]|uniref:ABC transporter substrate-binding protein n=1 Tax=Desulfothermobacter acidiphilus TaxID=1938353 RepID=UPI003F8CCF54